MSFSSNTGLIQRLLWLALFGLPLSACSSLGTLGGESFTLAGELPANFFIKGQAYYYVANGCDGRADVKTFKNSYQDQAQQYNFTIPVNYRDGLCEMGLARVDLFIHGRYGDKDWQQTYADGGLLIVDKLPEGAPGFQADGSLTKQAQCTWLFQISKVYLELSKLLNCKGAGAYLLRDELPRKTVRLEFRVNPEEKPAVDETWVKFQNSWKPCAQEMTAKGQWIWCRNPPQFRTFQMNGRECTAYPNCTE